MDLEFKDVTSGEKSRTYQFAEGVVTVRDVARVAVRPSGSHRLETKDGRKFIIAAGWLAIEIDAAEWSF